MNVNIYLRKKLFENKFDLEKAVDNFFKKDPYFSEFNFEFFESKNDVTHIEIENKNNCEKYDFSSVFEKFLDCYERLQLLSLPK